jgi:hypothetical protein
MHILTRLFVFAFKGIDQPQGDCQLLGPTIRHPRRHQGTRPQEHC